MDDSGYYTTYSSDPTATAASPIAIIFGLAILVLMVASIWRLYQKAGKPGWAAIVPFYNTWVMTKIADKSAVWFILTFIPIANIVASIVITYNFMKAYGKGAGMTVLALLFPYVVFPVLGFSKSVTYVGNPDGDSAAVPSGPTTSPTTPTA